MPKVKSILVQREHLPSEVQNEVRKLIRTRVYRNRLFALEGVGAASIGSVGVMFPITPALVAVSTGGVALLGARRVVRLSHLVGEQTKQVVKAFERGLIAGQYREEYKSRYPSLPGTLAELSKTHPLVKVDGKGNLEFLPRSRAVEVMRKLKIGRKKVEY